MFFSLISKAECRRKSLIDDVSEELIVNVGQCDMRRVTAEGRRRAHVTRYVITDRELMR